MRSLVSPVALCALLLVAPGLAHEVALPPAEALRDGALRPAEAAARWRAGGVSPEAAHAALARLPLLPAPAGDPEVPLEDGLGRETTARVVLPPDGPGPDGRYRVLIVLHGAGGNARQVLGPGRGLLPPHTILVAPSALRTPDELDFEDLRGARGRPLPVARQFPNWWSYREDAFPLLALEWVRRRYPVDDDRVVLAGYSMGGFGAWNLGLRYHDRFAGLAPLAGGISRGEYFLQRDELSRALLDNAAMVPAFFVHGARDTVVPVFFDRWTRRDLEARGIAHTYVELKDGRHMLPDVLEPEGEVARALARWIDERRRDPHPARVVHRVVGTYHGGAYWVRVDAHAGNTAWVSATARAGRIEVETRGVTRLTVFLDPKLVDPTGPVTVVVDGRVAHEGVVPESLEAVAASFARARDAALTYRHAVTLEVAPREVEELPSPLDGWRRRS